MYLRDTVTERAWALAGHTGSITFVAFAPDGRTLVSASKDGSVRVWNLPTDEGQLVQAGAREEPATAIAFGTAPQTLYVARSNRIEVMDVEQHTLVKTIVNPEGDFLSLDPIDGGKRLLSMNGTSQKVLLWDPASGSQRTVIHTEAEPQAMDISHSGKLIAVQERNIALDVVEVETGRVLCRFTEGGLNGFSFSPDEKEVVYGSGGARTQVHLVQLDGCRSRVIHRARGLTQSASFSPDGSRIATGSEDRKVGMWERATGLVHFFTGHTVEVYTVAFSPDGKTLASVSGDKTVRRRTSPAAPCAVVPSATTPRSTSAGGRPKGSWPPRRSI